ncbi:hypothetical protein [Halomonas sp. M20]|uniref:hypothetical protein n=1 Tax=Halomonas sp. M20 TaxID=2763264 RepID=UPI001D0A3722|nr:hypothetical protein [Halomonas sp. M20]
MKIALLTATLLTSISIAGSALAMDSDAVEKKMAEISQQAEQTAQSESEIKALKQQVQELEDLVRMMTEEEQK